MSHDHESRPISAKKTIQDKHLHHVVKAPSLDSAQSRFIYKFPPRFLQTMHSNQWLRQRKERERERETKKTNKETKETGQTTPTKNDKQGKKTDPPHATTCVTHAHTCTHYKHKDAISTQQHVRNITAPATAKKQLTKRT